MLDQLNELRYTSKILLAAELNNSHMNPVDYVFKALNLKFSSLDKKSHEFEALLNQIDKTREDGMQNN